MNGINPSGSASNSINTSGFGTKEVSQEGFMKLLLAQIKMQNPLNPFDSSTMMQQISQLTGLSATQDLAKSVDVFKSNLGTSQVLEASRLIGKEVQVASDAIQLTDTHVAKGAVLVPKGIEAIDVAVCDKSGKQIRTLKLNAPSEGVLDFSWDGLDDSGKSVEPGFYTFAAKGLVAGEQVPMQTAATVKVNSVALDRTNGIVIMNVDGLGGISMNDVVKIL